MKILLLTNHLNPGGITTYTLSLAKGLKKRGHIVKLASRGGAFYERLRELDIEHIYLNLHTKSEVSPKIFFAKRSLLSRLKKDKPDILHCQTRITRVLGQFIKNKTDIPFVSTAHGFYKLRLGNRLFPCWGEGAIAISEAVKRDLMLKFNLDAKKIRIIYNGIDWERFGKIVSDLEKDKTKEELGLNSRRVIVSISRLSFIKGQAYLVKAMKKVIQDFPDVSCVIIGEGEAEDILKEEVEKLNLGQWIKFVKSIDDTRTVLSIADIFVLPTMQEGLGLAILEAMASGIPVISTDIGGIPEIIEDGKNGLLVPAQDAFALSEAILRVLKDDCLRADLGERAQITVKEKFSLERMVDETENFYKIVTESYSTR